MKKAKDTAASYQRYVYVMGRGHSGSTVLDALLGNAANGRGVGELVMGVDGTYPCSCGEYVNDCQFWTDVQASYHAMSKDGDVPWKMAATLIAGQANILQYLPTWLSRKGDARVQTLSSALRHLAESVATVSETPIVIDSSKEISRGLFLARHMPEARILHIVRDPRRMLASNLHRLRDGSGMVLFRRTFRSMKSAPFVIALSALSWLIGNLLCEEVHRLAPERVIRVRYESLCAAPARELRRIGSFTGLDLSDVIQAVEDKEELPIEHKLAGNRMAKRGSFVFQPSRSSGRPIPSYLERIGEVITAPLLKRYGY